MTILEREFQRSARGPAPTDYDTWRLVLDQASAQLIVRHEWQSTGHSGADDFTLAEFLAQESAVRDALVAFLFDK